MMLRESFGLGFEADWIEAAVDRALEKGSRTPDIAGPGSRAVACSALVERIRAEMSESLAQAERYGWGV